MSIFTATLPATIKHLHFIGMRGVGVSALAIISKGMGYTVTGSDVATAYGATGESLKKAGISCYEGFDASHITPDIDLIIVGAAFGETNTEVIAAQKIGIPLLTYSKWLGHLLTGKESIAVAGIHGKTTTTSWIAALFLWARRDPTFLVGAGTVPDLGTNAQAGKGSIMVVEADEYHVSPTDHRPKIWDLHPRVAIITSIEWDHPDVFPSLEAVRSAFVTWMDQMSEDSTLIIHGDDPQIQLALQETHSTARIETYGLSPNNDWSVSTDLAQSLLPTPAPGTVTIIRHGKPWLSTPIGRPGVHNRLNALAVAAVGDLEGVSKDVIAKTLSQFQGAQRRFDVQEIHGVTWVDDYAHHPTAIRMTLEAARERYPGRRIIALFQPHTFSRTEALLQEFAQSFASADRVILLPIFGSTREKTGTISSRTMRDLMPHAEEVLLPESLDEAFILLQTIVQKGDVVLTIGAGDIFTIRDRALNAGGFPV